MISITHKTDRKNGSTTQATNHSAREVPFTGIQRPQKLPMNTIDDNMLPELEELVEEEYYLQQLQTDTDGVSDEDSAFEALNDNDDNFDYLLNDFDDGEIIKQLPPVSPSTVSIAERNNSTGVYVYTYPRLLGENTSLGKTSELNDKQALLKISSSNVDIQKTVEHTKVNNEDIVVVRIYPTTPSKSLIVEQKFQRLLSTIEAQYEQEKTFRDNDDDHWFRTSLSILDGIAQTLELDIVKPSVNAEHP